MLMNWPSVDVVPKILVLPPDAADLGEAEAAIELWEHYSRKTLDPDQRIAVYVMMAMDSAGKWAAKTTGREKPRQNGKGDEVEVVELWGLVQRAEAILHTVHDAVLLSTQTQQRMLGVLEGHADLRRRIGRVWKGTGQQMIELRNGGTIWYRTRTAKGGLGVDDVDRVVLDEAQEAAKEHLAAIAPTMLANSNSQLNALGTSGKTGVSAWWWRQRKRALSADPGRFGYVGTTAENVCLDAEGRVVQEPVDARNRALWLDVNPAVRAGRGEGMEFLEEQLQRMGPELFAREHLGVWDPPDDEDEGATWGFIPEADWSNAATRETSAKQAKPGWLSDPVTASVEMTMDRSVTSIQVAGTCREGGVGVEVAAIGPSGSVDLATELQAIADRQGGKLRVAIDKGGPAATEIQPVTDAGFEVVALTFEDVKRATGDFYDAAVEGDIVHRCHPELDASMAQATRRNVGDVFLLDRKASNVAAANGVILARWGHLQGYDDGESIYETRGMVTL